MGIKKEIKNLAGRIDEWEHQQARKIVNSVADRDGLDYHARMEALRFIEKTDRNYSLTRAVIEPFYNLRWDHKKFKERGETNIPHRLFIYGATMAIEATRLGAFVYLANMMLNCVRQQ